MPVGQETTPHDVSFTRGEDNKGDPILEVRANGIKKGTIEKRGGKGTLAENVDSHYILKSEGGAMGGGHPAIDLKTQGDARDKAIEIWSARMESISDVSDDNDSGPRRDKNLIDAVDEFKESKDNEKYHPNNAAKAMVGGKSQVKKSNDSGGRGKTGIRY